MSARKLGTKYTKLVGVVDAEGNLAAVGLPHDEIRNIQTAGAGSNYTALPDVPGARMVRIMGPAVDLHVRRVGETDTVTAKADLETVIYVASNSNELELRRADEDSTQAAVELLIGVY